MNAERLLEVYEQISEAPDAIARLRRFVLDLAVRGKLVDQDAGDEPASTLVRRLTSGKDELIRSKVIKKPRELGSDDELIQPHVLPTSWRWCRLDTVGAIVGGGTPSAGDASNFEKPGSGVAWLTPADLGGNTKLYISHGARDLSDKGLASSSATLMPAGSVLFTSRAPIGYVAIAGNPIATNQGFKSVVPYLSECSQFIALALKALALEIDAKASGTTFKEVSGKIVAGIPFPLPPLAEQHRIVAKVDELMTLCDRLEEARKTREEVRDKLTAASLARLTAPDTAAQAEPAKVGTGFASGSATIKDNFPAHAAFALEALPALTTRPDQIKTIRKTILNLAVRGKLVEQDPTDGSGDELLRNILAVPWEKKRKAIELEPDEAAMASAFLLPPNWTWATVQALTRLNQTVTYGILKPEWMDEGVPTVRVTEMKTGEIDVSALPRCRSERAAKFAKTTLEAGDLLVSKDGTIGKTAFVPPELVGGNITQHVLRFPICEQVDRRFVRLAIDAPFCQSWMDGETKGVALQGVNVGDFRRMPIPLPPLAEQHRIVAKVDALMTLCDRLEATLTTTDTTRTRLLESLLHEALEPTPNALEAAE